ncbi:hypothetical protein C5689_09210 [Methylosinus sporium]|uniref:DUF1640 domain-containing protein n=2 Tax=Methylosinus sporium TaxID=428 RepID=A0A2U1SR69_METSR|nr:hypothetical protein C5689_09210 [Methylosinus sporium]
MTIWLDHHIERDGFQTETSGEMSASAILKLQAAGFSTEQVTALAELIDSQAATKADLEAAKHELGAQIGGVKSELGARIDSVKSDLEAAKHELGGRIDSLEHSLGSKIDAVDHRLDMKIARLDGEFALVKWMLGFTLAFEVALFYKLFLH